MSGKVILETDRLVLREQSRDDLEDLYAVLGDETTMAYYPRPFTRDEVLERWIVRHLLNYQIHGYSLWGMVLKSDGTFIGQCGLWPQTIERKAHVEIGWHVNRAYQNQGFATEAAVASREHAFALGLDHVVSLIRPENVPSVRVAEKVGMEPWKQTVYKNIPHVIYRLDSDD